MPTAVDTLFENFSDTILVLQQSGEISLASDLDGNFRKTLLLSAASYFEYRLTRVLLDYVEESAGGNDIISSMIRVKAVSRLYHTWFNWKEQGAAQFIGPFYGMLGREFSRYMKERLANNADEASALDAFASIGRDRNRLVHEDFASFSVEKTSDEIYASYQIALRFVDGMPNHLRQCGNGAQAAIRPQ